MKFRKLVVVMFFVVYALINASTSYAQNLNPCSPTTIPKGCNPAWEQAGCNRCSDVPWQTKYRTVATTGYTGCLWDVEYGIRCCNGRTEIKINWIRKSYPVMLPPCETCSGAEGNSGWWSEIARTVEFEIMRLERYSTYCNPNPLLIKTFVSARPKCFRSRTVLGGGGTPIGGGSNSSGVYIEPCNNESCCLTEYRQKLVNGVLCLDLVYGPCSYGPVCDPGCVDVCD